VSSEPAGAADSSRPALDRLELRIERLGITFRLTYAFHAREVRFERDAGEGFLRIFPETYSFHAGRHDPAELYLQFDDLMRKPALLSPEASRRDSQVLITRLMLGIPRYLDGLFAKLEREGRVSEGRMVQVCEDVALFSRLAMRFLRDRVEEDGPGVRIAHYHFRKLSLVALSSLMQRRVDPAYLDAYVVGSVDPVNPVDDLSEEGFSHTMASDDPGAVNRYLVRLAERAFYDWVEDVCLETENTAFEVEGSPFEDREIEMLRAIGRGDATRIRYGRELSPFLRLQENRNCQRVLGKLERWFLRQYDIHHAAVVIHHADNLRRGRDDADRVLSRHRARNYTLVLFLMASPFIASAFAYDRDPLFFDVLCSAEMIVIDAVVLWFLLYRFCWKRDLTFFHSAVPRIGAGIIVGYLPIFFIDEVWYLAQQSALTIALICLLLGFANLLYLYVEVKRKLADPTLAFSRARRIFILGVLQAFTIGLLLTGMIGGFMALRNWQSGSEVVSLGALGDQLPHFVGQLPMITGIEPFYAFPSAVFLMTFLSFFIGTFLQLMWEELPITEPL